MLFSFDKIQCYISFKSFLITFLANASVHGTNRLLKEKCWKNCIMSVMRHPVDLRITIWLQIVIAGNSTVRSFSIPIELTTSPDKYDCQ
uniref:Uncharacterized protein n=1 Tax=Romanomermis culicivorax TaxID=13658 RepID=A0A915IRI1_ROMCU